MPSPQPWALRPASKPPLPTSTPRPTARVRGSGAAPLQLPPRRRSPHLFSPTPHPRLGLRPPHRSNYPCLIGPRTFPTTHHTTHPPPPHHPPLSPLSVSSPSPSPSPSPNISKNPKTDSSSSSSSSYSGGGGGADLVAWQATVLARHLRPLPPPPATGAEVEPAPCVAYAAPELSEKLAPAELRRLIDSHDVELRDRLFWLMEESPLFRGGRAFAAPDYNQTKEQ